MKVSALNFSQMIPIGLTSANSPQFGDLLQGFRQALNGPSPAKSLEPPVRPAIDAPRVEAREPQPAAPQPAGDRAARLKAATAAAALAPWTALAEAPSVPGGMANGSTASLLARGSVKIAPGPGQDRPQTASEFDAGAVQRVDQVSQVAMGMGRSGDAPTPDLPRRGFPETAEGTGISSAG